MCDLTAEKDQLIGLADAVRIPKLLTCVIQLEDCIKRWCRENYAYKGAEIAQRALTTLERRTWRGDGHKACAAELKTRFKRLERRFRLAESCWKGRKPYHFEGDCQTRDSTLI